MRIANIESNPGIPKIVVKPIVVMLIVFFTNPDYIKPMFNTPDGQLALVGAVGLITAGFISINKISQIEM